MHIYIYTISYTGCYIYGLLLKKNTRVLIYEMAPQAAAWKALSDEEKAPYEAEAAQGRTESITCITCATPRVNNLCATPPRVNNQYHPSCQ